MKSTITAISLRPFSYQLVSMLAFFSLIGFAFNSRLVAQEKEVITGISNVPARYKSIRMNPIRLYLRPSRATEIGLLKQRQKSKVFEDNISTELMSKMPVSDAGDALKRVTGISVVGGKYVYVRGLGERYSNTLLNEVEVPSPEPTRRVVPMDIFPANLIQSLQVMKTFSPDQPGSFAGGSVQVHTKDFPDKRTLSFSASTGLNSGVTGKDTLRYDGGKFDFLGFDDGSREIPRLVSKYASQIPIRERGLFSKQGFSAADIAVLGKTFNNEWTPYQSVAPANQGYKFTYGDTSTVWGKQIGYLAILSYSNSYSNRQEVRNTFTLKGVDQQGSALLAPYTEYKVERSINDVMWGGVLNASLRFNESHITSLKTIFSHNGDNQARTWEGYNMDRATDMKSARLMFVERQLVSSQLSGNHKFGQLNLGASDTEIKQRSQLTWRLALSRAKRDQPDTREMVYERGDLDLWYFRDITQSGCHFFFDLEDVEISGRVDWRWWFNSETELKVGGLYRDRNRDFDARRFRFLPADGIDDRGIDLTWPGEKLFAKENIAPRIFELRESTLATDNYTAAHRVGSAYTMLSLPISKKIQLSTGIRMEDSRQSVTTFDPFAAELVPIVAEIDKADFLPGINLIYQLTDQANLRTAVSRTLTRPDLREMAPFEFTDFVGGRTELGDPDLKQTTVDNYDLRWEFFPQSGGVVSVSTFYKQFTNPIEQIVVPAAEVRITYANAERANNYGIECEFRRNFSFIHPALKNYSINSNLAWINSKVKLPDRGSQTSSERALQGQSPYVINLTLAYDSENSGITSMLTFHQSGERISEVGNNGIPDVYEMPKSQLDLSFSRRLGSNIKIGFSAKNLLNRDVIYSQGGENYLIYNLGRSFSISLGYSL